MHLSLSLLLVAMQGESFLGSVREREAQRRRKKREVHTSSPSALLEDRLCIRLRRLLLRLLRLLLRWAELFSRCLWLTDEAHVNYANEVHAAMKNIEPRQTRDLYPTKKKQTQSKKPKTSQITNREREEIKTEKERERQAEEVKGSYAS